MKLKDILISWDFIIAILITSGLYFLIDFWVDNAFVITAYQIGISVLSIVFSVFFAALAIIISSSDDDFVSFLDETGDYTAIISTFKFSLMILFFALVYSIVLTVITSYWINIGHKNQQFFFFILFTFLFSWGLFATLNSTLDAIKYSSFRTEYLKIKKNSQDQR